MIYLYIWLALGVASVIYCLVTEGAIGEMFSVEGAFLTLVLIILGPILGIFQGYLHFSMRNK